MMDSMPLWFAVPALIALWIGWPLLEFRASKRYWAERGAADPVVVTGSGRPSNRYTRSCRYEEVR